MWSIGCIFGEMILRLPLFYSESIVQQINKILLVLGTPDKQDVYGIDSAKEYLFGLSFHYPPSDTDLFPQFEDKEGLDLFHKMMNWNPYKRISVSDALKHSFFDDLRKEEGFVNLEYFEERDFDNSFLDDILKKGEKRFSFHWLTIYRGFV
jgi:mitogen-activated protein kinase 1/3